MNEEGLVKVRIGLPNHWAIGGEAMWAEPLGNDLYRLENVPFFAYDLNLHDVVRATPDAEGQIPEIREVVERSGRRTFRIYFEDHIEADQRKEILDSLRELTISWEQQNAIHYSLDMRPEGNYHNVFDRLTELEEQNIIGFETCEARVEGSFDDSPEEDEE